MLARVFGPFSISDKPVVLNPGCIRGFTTLIQQRSTWHWSFFVLKALQVILMCSQVDSYWGTCPSSSWQSCTL